jgi:hypothetical protein
MSDDQPDNLKKKAENALLNKPWIAYPLIGATVLGALMGLVSGAIDIWKSLVPVPEVYDATEIADEYYILVAQLDSEEQARSMKDRLKKLSELSLKYDGLDIDNLAYSTDIRIGYDPNQVVFARSIEEDGKWIVGIDPVEGEGSIKDFDKMLFSIRQRFSNVEHEYANEPDHELYVAAKELSPLIDGAIVKYFSISEYRDRYEISLDKE